MIINDKQKYLLLRYSSSYEKDCIVKHIEVLRNLGYCWFGKVGSVPSQKIMKQVFDENQKILVLYKKNSIYICRMQEYSLVPPVDGVPQYYVENSISPSIYFKLLSIEPCSWEIIHNSTVVSTGAYVEDVFLHSQIPFMLCSYSKLNSKELLDENDCRYKVNGICKCKSCVNFDCLCDRPRSCIKQRR